MTRRLPLCAALLAAAAALPGRQARSQPPEKYHTARELAARLEALEARHRGLARLVIYGRSHERRDLLAVELTEGGEAASKPGVLVAAGLRGDEPGASEVTLRVLERLLERRAEPAVAALLRTRSFYFIPRGNPDAVERLLQRVPAPQRSALAPLDDDADEAEDEDGPADVDGDGLVLRMRLRDPAGDWRTDPADSRVLVRRKPGEPGEWRLFALEGRDADGDGLVAEDGPGGTDLDRNFPALWEWRPRQPGAGPFMVSAVETRALLDYALARRNIALAVVPHVTGAQPFQPATRLGATAPAADRAHLERLEKLWEEKTGGRRVTPAADPEDPGHGSLLDWLYLHFGALAVSPEVWAAPPAAAGAPAASAAPASPEKPWLEWSDRELGGDGFVKWKPFRHPDLGEVEIGGWKPFTRDNPPPRYLAGLADRGTGFLEALAGMSPLLRLREASAAAKGAGVFQVRAVLANEGGTPTACAQGVANRTTRPVLAVLELPAGARLLTGILRVRLGQLAPGETKAVEWTVHAPAGGRVKLTADGQRSGAESREVELR